MRSRTLRIDGHFAEKLDAAKRDYDARQAEHGGSAPPVTDDELLYIALVNYLDMWTRLNAKRPAVRP